MYCLDPETGRALWRFTTRSQIRGGATVAGGMVLFGSRDKHLYAVSLDGR